MSSVIEGDREVGWPGTLGVIAVIAIGVAEVHRGRRGSSGLPRSLGGLPYLVMRDGHAPREEAEEAEEAEAGSG